MERYSLEGSRVLVIGGAGFIGSHIVEELLTESVEEIIIFDNFSRGTIRNLKNALKDPRVKIYPNGGDIRDEDILEDAMKGVDYVFHLAALWLLHCHDFPKSAFEVNIRGTFNVIETARKTGVKRIVFSSSASVYGDALEYPMSEDHPLNNKNFYGATKISGEQMLRAYFHRYGLDYVGLRYANVYGPRQDTKSAYTSVVIKWMRAILSGENVIVHGGGDQTYDFVFVKDVAKANVLALKFGHSDSFYNIGTGIPTNLKKLLNIIIEIYKITHGEEPSSKVVYNRERIHKSFVTKRVLDISKAEKELGYFPKYDLRTGLKITFEWLEREMKF